ncbi:SIR2 family protein [Bacillus inaquosorum]|uniref:SIR2 family NAD-dependent protein deacylase n=2 Tax=Bacillus inaquosorum TaxID=483913 RepID=UPI0022831761|nr:SIR2 family protein [Bacillus inaquosorum]MCY8282858.1 SIR2 family protein [Bacillus inaquosorum]
MSKDVNIFFKKKLMMYPHLENIRNNLWFNEGKSRVSVMIGAGFSLNAQKIEQSFSGIAIWNEIKERLIDKLPHYNDIREKDVLTIGQIYVEEYGRSSLDQILKDAVPDNNYEPGELHYKLLNLPWADVYTTNYDTLLERAKKNIFNRNYQVIYDISDIPSSEQPRIVKLHGSFPANRPFIFTAKDYENYPINFSPFVNMVQQSIMETIFVLIGFSGDDPNFHSWTSWVQNNLGEHKPKIYMIGYNQTNRKKELERLGITLIDFEEIYKDHENPYVSMFSDLFEFLSFKQREEKTLWPHRSFIKSDTNTWRYNRETYPGWTVIPDDIRRDSKIRLIRIKADGFLKGISIDNVDETTLVHINEILWFYDRFHVPLQYDQKKKLKKILDEYINNKENNELILPILFNMLKVARLDLNIDQFTKYVDYIENIKINNQEYLHSLVYEKIQFHLLFKDIKTVKSLLLNWEVSSREVEWGIKKAIVYLRIDDKKAAKKMFEDYIKVIRSLLAVNMDDFRLLSLESIALYHRNKLMGNTGKENYDRLKTLGRTYCDVNKELSRISVSIKKYEESNGIKTTRGFDPNSSTTTSTYGYQLKQELLDSFALVQIEEAFYMSPRDKYDHSQFMLAFNNIETLYPLYGQIKKVDFAKIKNINDFLNREEVFKLQKNNVNVIWIIIKNVFSNKNETVIDLNKYIEILSRVYFMLSNKQKAEADKIVLNYISEIELKSNEFTTKKILMNLIRRLFLAKNLNQARDFCMHLLTIPIRSQMNKDNSTFVATFFDPFLSIINETHRISNIKTSEDQVNFLFDHLNFIEDQGIKESAVIRLTFLYLTSSLNKQQSKNFITEIKKINKEQPLSQFIYNVIFDKIINEKKIPSYEIQHNFLKREIPNVYHQDGIFSDGDGLLDYLQELKNIFLNFVELNKEKVSEIKIYKQWLNKFYDWWDTQKEGLLQITLLEDPIIPNENDLLKIIIVLKNNILGPIPKELIDQEDKGKLSKVFQEIKEKNKDISFYLVPCMKRLDINIEASIDEAILFLRGNKSERIKILANILYDYLILVNKSEISDDMKTFKNELFNLLRYGSKQTICEAITSIHFILKNAPEIFDEFDCEFLITFANIFLEDLKGDSISTYEDFETLSSFSVFVAYLIKNKKALIGNRLNEWKTYITNHKLPEVRVNSDIFDIKEI